VISEYAKYLSRCGGIATVGQHLAVMIAPSECLHSCPAGWGFVDLEDATPELVQETIDEVKRGRSAWPTDESGSFVRREQ